MQLYSVMGNSQRLDGGSMFGNAPRAVWQRWFKPDEQHRIPLACRALLARDLNGLTILFETGIGAFFDPKLRDRYGVVEAEHVLLESLRALELEHQDIDVVVLSHLHFDHAGGLLAAWQQGQPARLLFPKARFVCSKRGWERAQKPHFRDRASFIPELVKLLEDSGRLELVDAAHTDTLGDSVRFHYSDGHTPGLMLAEIGGNGGLVFCSYLIPGRPWVHLPITMGYDCYPERLIDEKQQLLADWLQRDVRLFFTHDPDCALASVSQDERGRFGTCTELPRLDGLALD